MEEDTLLLSQENEKFHDPNTSLNREPESFLATSTSDRRSWDQHVSYGSINGATVLNDPNRDLETASDGLRFRKLQPGMLTTLSSKFESFDYDICESRLFKEDIGKKKSWSLIHLNSTRWVVMFFIGVSTALVASGVDICVAEISKLKYNFIKKNLSSCIDEGCLIIPLTLLIGISISFSTFAALLVVYIEPVAAGSGIPLVKCYLNGINIHRLVRFRTLIVKSLGVACSVLGGLAVGKEGPMVHSGAVIAAGLSQGKSTSINWDLGLLKQFRSDQEKRDFVTGGAAAGVAAAFGAPIGGVLFSLEEGSSFWNQSLTWRILFCSMVSAFTLNAILSAYHGQPGQFAYSGLLNFGKFNDMPFAFWELPIFIGMGIIGGLTGALFNQMNYYLSVFRKRWISSNWAKVLEVIVVCIFTVITGCVMIYLINDCKPVGQDNVEFPIQMFCKDGEFNAVAAMWFQTPEASVRSLFHDQAGTHKPLSVGLFFIFYFLLACWTYGLSISSGIFIPALLSGAAWGRLIGLGLYTVSQGASWADPGKYALIGAASQLGGIVRVTISLAAILIETTGNLSLGLGLMLTLLTAKLVGDLFNVGIYDMHVQLAGLPMLPWAAPPLSHNISAKNIMSSPVVVFKCIEKVSYLLEQLESCSHQGFPVVDDRYIQPGRYPCFGVLRGSILRSQLKILLKEKAFCGPSGLTLRPPVPLQVFQNIYPHYPKLTDLHISELEKTLYVDLRPYMNATPYTIHMNTSLPRTFQLFRALGLRHLIVTNDHYEVVGMITRKNLARHRARICCGTMDFVELTVEDNAVDL